VQNKLEVILLVEDEPGHVEAILRALKGAGAVREVRLAGSLREYHEAVTTKSPDIVLMDMNLPDGRAVEILTSPPENGAFPVLIMTSYGNERIAVEAMKAGALDYIVKSPDAFAAMPRTIERALREWHLLQERKRGEETIRHSLDKLRRAIQTTIQVLVLAVETKDPYTAGHQRRMTNLARAMATEMGLPPEQIEGIRMAGIVHDIGKISLPAEILSKPSKLTEIEYSLVKAHVKGSYDILKDVESPWPLAEIVYQHHERMDGSGYPRGLKGAEILIEGRILAVADVVEAIASYRPYRPALGIDAALGEIAAHKGTLYDPGAVDACLKLFREKNFGFEADAYPIDRKLNAREDTAKLLKS